MEAQSVCERAKFGTENVCTDPVILVNTKVRVQDKGAEQAESNEAGR